MNSQELWVHVYGRLKSCKSISTTQLKQLHSFLIKTRPLPLKYPNLISSPPSPPHKHKYSHSTHILSFLNHLEKPDLCLSLYNAIIQGLPSNPTTKTASLFQLFELLEHMLANGILPDHYTVPSVLKACAQLRALREGQQIHAYAIKTGLVLSNVYVNNTLMRVYAVCGVMKWVRMVFDESPQRDLVSWTTLIQAYVKMGFPREGVEAFFRMCDAEMRADEMTLVIVLSACSKLGDLSLGRKINGYIYDNGVCRDVFIGNALVDMYLKCGDADFARKVFNEMPVRNVVSWNSMISGLAHQGKFKEALYVFRGMQKRGLEPDEVTYIGVLAACSHGGLVAEDQRYFREMSSVYKLRPQTEHYGCTVDLLGRAGLINEAEEFVENMPTEPDAFVWGALLGPVGSMEK